MRVLVHDPVLRSRLQVVAALSGAYEVSVIGDGVEPIKAVRRVAPDVLISNLGADADAALRLVRTVRTDGGPVPRMGLYEPAPHRVGPELAIGVWGADGWLGDVARIGEFVAEISHASLAVRIGEHQPGLLSRLGRHLRRFTV